MPLTLFSQRMIILFVFLQLYHLIGSSILGDVAETIAPNESSGIEYIHSPKLAGECLPGMCCNGTSAFSADVGEVFIDQLIPCHHEDVVYSQQLGNISLEPDVYCDSKTMRGVPRLTCCSPEKPTSDFPRLYLYPVNSSAIKSKPSRLDWTRKSDGQKLSKSNEIVILVPGWTEKPIEKGSLWIYPVLEAWTQVRKRPVIVVDFDKQGTYQYFQNAADARTIGQAIGYALINWNITDRAILVGFSLGGQIIGEAGKYTTNHSKPIKECVGLDPAGPGFDGGSDRIRLTPEDCQLVQVIHSSAEPAPTSMGIFSAQFGTFSHSGSCDFWINCGRTQGMDCKNPTLGAMMNDVPSNQVNDSNESSCQHYRATLVYAASVAKKCNFLGYPCTDCDDSRLTNGCHVNFNGSSMALPPFNSCKKSDRKDFYVRAPSNNYPYCPDDPAK